MVDPSAPAALERRKRVLVPLAGKSQLDANRRLFEWCAVNLVDAADDVFVFHFTRAKKTGMSALRAATTQRPGVCVININAGADTEGETEAEKKRREETAAAEGCAFGEAEWLPRDVSDALRKHRAACPSSVVSVFEVDLDSGFNTAEVRDARDPVHPPRERRNSDDPHARDAPRTMRRESSSRQRVETQHMAQRPRRTNPEPSDASDVSTPRSKRNESQEAISEMCAGAFESPPVGMPEALVVPRPDLVCVGSRGQKFLKRVVLGSVSSGVLAAAAAPCCVYRSTLPSPSEDEIAARQKLGDEEQPQRVVCLALSGSDASHSVAEWSARRLLRPSDRVVVLHCDDAKKARRRNLSEAHVSANLAACEETIRAFMTAHPDPRGATQLFRLEESPDLSSDVRDRLVDFLDKTDVGLLVLGRSNRVGGFRTWTVGTVPMYAVQHGKCPVLVVNPTTESAGEDAAAEAGGTNGAGAEAEPAA